MTDTNLPWLLFGRRIRPFAFATMLATAVIAVGLLGRRIAGDWLDTWAGAVIGVAAATVVVTLLAGWLYRSERSMIVGLFGSAGVWTTVTVTLAAEGVSWLNWALAACWAIASGGAYLLEVVNARVTTR